MLLIITFFDFCQKPKSINILKKIFILYYFLYEFFTFFSDFIPDPFHINFLKLFLGDVQHRDKGMRIDPLQDILQEDEVFNWTKYCHIFFQIFGV